ncbi:MAG: Na+/H+ antiporter subunit E [Candidatus Latescibacteria bacterium]|nr:Na+/H+ antiporter subunit E [Candidatus Latescibacterota bacterium]
MRTYFVKRAAQNAQSFRPAVFELAAFVGHLYGPALGLRLCRRMKIVDPEGHPIHLIPGLLRYMPWFLWAIVKSNLDVVRRIVHPRMPLSPRLIRVEASQKTHLGQVIYANSITLTPGTVSVETDEGIIDVHALTREAAEDVRSGGMDRRVTDMEGES